MKAVGDGSLSLPWIVPCASSLVSLAKDGPAAWTSVHTDPGAVLLLLRAAGPTASPASVRLSLLDNPNVLQLAQSLLMQSDSWVDWTAPNAIEVYHAAIRQAALASTFADELPGCDPDKAWIAGLLASLGRLAAVALRGCSGCPVAYEPTVLTRRLAYHWRLPDWLGAVIGHLGLHVSVAQRLGADPRLFQVVQLALALDQRDHAAATVDKRQATDSLHAALGWSQEFVERLNDQARRQSDVLLTQPRSWRNPANQPLLADLLDLASPLRRRRDQELIDRLQRDVDQLQLALEEHQERDRERLQTLKLTALAELAAGAGHEINNPLAVISGQAQYAIKQMQHAEAELVEDAAALAILQELKGGLERSLHAIVGQAQRVHHVLLDLMQFARPSAPRRQSVRLAALMREVAQSVQPFADHRKVRLVLVEPPESWQVHVDAAQIRTALAGLLRNAVEAAAPEGWAGLRAEARGDAVGLIVEDNGQGPAPLALEHMFDPFFSGRSAGRGRGLGLPTAWRLARQHGGDVRYEGVDQGLTRFALTLPDLEVKESHPPYGNGHYQERKLVNGSH